MADLEDNGFFTGLEGLEDPEEQVQVVEQFDDVEFTNETVQAIADEARAIEEVDRRLEKAIYYREVLKTQLFEDTSQVAQDVNEEIREYVRNRLQILMGIKEEESHTPIELQFTQEEAEQIKSLLARFDTSELVVLKALATRFLKKPSLMEPAAKPEVKPVIHQVAQRPAKVEKAPVVVKQKARIKRVQSPAAATPAAAPAVKHTASTGKTQVQIIERDGQKVVKVGRKLYKRAVNDEGKFYAKDITAVPRHPTALPFPSSPESMQAAMADQAVKSANANPALLGAGQVSKAVAIALAGKNQGEEE